jgi:methionine-rich copper-binding protein CopC
MIAGGPPMKCLLATVLLLAASVVAAHTALVSSTPKPKATVSAPKEIGLLFADDVRLTAVVLVDASGAEKKMAALPTAVAKKFAVAIQDPLPPGAYTVTWRAVGADTHVVSGDFRFTVAEAL